MSVLTLLTAHYYTGSPAVPFNLFLVEKSREQFTIHKIFFVWTCIGSKFRNKCFYRKLESSFTKFIFQVNDEETAIHRIPFGMVKQYQISSPSSCYNTERGEHAEPYTSHLALLLLGQTWSSPQSAPPTCSILILKF